MSGKNSMNCINCWKDIVETEIIGTITKVTKSCMTIEVKARDKKPLREKENEFKFYLRRNQEFNFCSIKCLTSFMGYEK